MHVHIGAMEFLVTALYMLIALFFTRALAVMTKDTKFGAALGSIVA